MPSVQAGISRPYYLVLRALPSAGGFAWRPFLYAHTLCSSHCLDANVLQSGVRTLQIAWGDAQAHRQLRLRPAQPHTGEEEPEEGTHEAAAAGHMRSPTYEEEPQPQGG